MPRKQYKYHYIYKTTCNVTGKYYIGMHSTSNLEDGYFGSGKVLKRSLNKYGKENHSMEILEWLPDRSSLRLREKELVNESLLSDPMCMNLQLGGGGGFSGENHQLHCSVAGGLGYSKKLESSDFKEKMSNIRREKGKRLWTEGRGFKPFNWTDRKHSTDSKIKIGNANSVSQKGEKNSQFGLIWILNKETGESKKINKLESIPDGWQPGRKIKNNE